jgi:aminoglycoside phosphotransferase (APT) family kinase protein
LVTAQCRQIQVGRDRFVLRVDVETAGQRWQRYAVKGYVDAREERIWEVYQAVGRSRQPGKEIRLCLPAARVADEYLLIMPWIEGEMLSDALGAGRIDFLDQVASILADLHATPVVPEAETPATWIVDRTLERCRRLCKKFPDVEPIARPLMARLPVALPLLAPATPTLIHGDPGPQQFIAGDESLVLLDLDMCGYADPAYDAGQFLSELVRWSLRTAGTETQLPELCSRFHHAYRSAMPHVAAQNIAFYHGLTLMRSLIYAVRRERPPDLSRVVSGLAARAHAAFDAVAREHGL